MIDLDEIYEWGCEEFVCMVVEQIVIVNEILFGVLVEEVVVYFEVDFVCKFVGIDVLQKWMQEMSDWVVVEFVVLYFDIFEVIWMIECMIVFIQEGGIYYMGLMDDFFCFGCMWWFVLEGVIEFDIWCELMIVYYEGVFGYYLQIVQVVYNCVEFNLWC